MVKLSKFIKY